MTFLATWPPDQPRPLLASHLVGPMTKSLVVFASGCSNYNRHLQSSPSRLFLHPKVVVGTCPTVVGFPGPKFLLGTHGQMSFSLSLQLISLLPQPLTCLLDPASTFKSTQKLRFTNDTTDQADCEKQLTIITKRGRSRCHGSTYTPWGLVMVVDGRPRVSPSNKDRPSEG